MLNRILPRQPHLIFLRVISGKYSVIYIFGCSGAEESPISPPLHTATVIIHNCGRACAALPVPHWCHVIRSSTHTQTGQGLYLSLVHLSSIKSLAAGCISASLKTTGRADRLARKVGFYFSKRPSSGSYTT